jgi:lysozyme family protein
VGLADIIQMTDSHPIFKTSIPIHSSCLETKTASFDIKNTMSGGEVASATGGLLSGKFDIESLLAELTIDEKASLLSGIVAISSTSLRIYLNYKQERTSGTPRKSRD